MMFIVERADVLEWAASYTGPPFHALLCDPPYELGFMGKSWDKSGIAFKADTWAALARHLHPGAFVMAFASSRGWHRQAVAMEDAGLVIHPSLFGWAYGSGFPKATRIDTAVDRRGGVADVGWFGPWLREYREGRGIAQKELAAHFPSKTGGFTGCVANWELGFNLPTNEQFNKLVEVLGLPFKTLTEAEREVVDIAHDSGKRRLEILPTEPRDYEITAPSTPLARAWAGHRYGLQALKPALEPIIVAQKPYAGKPVESITRTGAGALNIEAGRIPGQVPNTIHGVSSRQGMLLEHFRDEPQPSEVSPHGRWPSNFYLADPEAAARLDEQSGDVKGAVSNSRIGQNPGYAGGWMPIELQRGPADSGGASRFFFNVSGAICEADPVYYTPKAGRWERDVGLDSFEKKDAQKWNEGGIKARREQTAQPAANLHPTIKPLDLTRYLARLLLPPPDYVPRRLLVPFAGVGSEMIGAILAGWEEVVGVEMEPDYCTMAEARIVYWREAGNKVLDDVVAAARYEEIREMKQKGQKGLEDFVISAP